MPNRALVTDEPDDLRGKLARAIRRRDELLADAARAQASFDSAKALLCDAAERAQALKAELDAESSGQERNGTHRRS